MDFNVKFAEHKHFNVGFDQSEHSFHTDMREKGADGVGIESIFQTQSSKQDGGENVITINLTNGKSYSFSVYNGTALESIEDLFSAHDNAIDAHSNMRSAMRMTNTQIEELLGGV